MRSCVHSAFGLRSSAPSPDCQSSCSLSPHLLCTPSLHVSSLLDLHDVRKKNILVRMLQLGLYFTNVQLL